MNKSIFITGTSSGLGFSLAKKFYNENYKVSGISRSISPSFINSKIINLKNIIEIKNNLTSFIENKNFDYVFLNAGIIDPIEKAVNIKTNSFVESLNINLISNKIILDLLITKSNIKKVIAITSGASKKPYDGWLNYCVSKSALNQLISCYALENKNIKFLSLAPGVIKTKMQDYIRNIDKEKFSSIEKFHNLYDSIPNSDYIANKIFNNLDVLNNIESGKYFDLRSINESNS